MMTNLDAIAAYRKRPVRHCPVQIRQSILFGIDLLQNQKERALRNAVRELDDTAVLAMLAEGMMPNWEAPTTEISPIDEGKSPLILEATRLLGNRPQAGLNIVKALLEKGANPFANDQQKRNSFLLACVRFSRAENEYLQLLKLFLDYAQKNQPARDPNLYSEGLNWLTRQAQCKTPESKVLFLNIADTLLNEGADPRYLVPLNKFDTLQLASMGLGEKSPKMTVRGPRDWPEMVRLLLTPRAGFADRTALRSNISPVTIAGAYGHVESLKLLLDAIPANEKPSAIQKALHYGILNDSQSTLDLLLPRIAQMPIFSRQTSTLTYNPLRSCLRVGNFNLFLKILKEYPQLKQAAFNSNLLHDMAKGMYPIRNSINWPFSDLPRPNVEFIRINGYDTEQDMAGIKTIPSPEGLNNLLAWLDANLPANTSMKILINAFDQNNYTPLMYAAERGFLSIIRQLIDAGADPSLKNDQSESALSLYLNAQPKLNLSQQTHQTILSILSPPLQL